MTAFQRILKNTERWNDTVVTPSLAKPLQILFVPIIYNTTGVATRTSEVFYQIQLMG